jgi:hypothetical protein
MFSAARKLSTIEEQSQDYILRLGGDITQTIVTNLKNILELSPGEDFSASWKPIMVDFRQDQHCLFWRGDCKYRATAPIKWPWFDL